MTHPSTRLLRIDDLSRIAVPSQPALSPDGSRLVYVLRRNDLVADSTVTALWTVDGERPARRLTDGTTDTSPRWAPDGSAIAFLRDRQLWLLPATGRRPRQLTRLPLGAGPAVWSPDGSAIAFSAPVDAAAEPGEDDSARAAAPIVCDGVDYQLDGLGFLRGVRLQIHLLDVASGTVRQVTDGDEHARSPAFSPDGTALAYLAKAHGNSDFALRSAAHLVPVHGPTAPPGVVAFDAGFATSVSFMPDGSRLVLTGWAGEPRGHARLYAADLRTGRLIELPAGLDRNVISEASGFFAGCLPQVVGDEVFFHARDRGCVHLYAVPLRGGTARVIHGGEGHAVSGLSVAGRTAAIALATPDSFGEIVTIDLGSGDATTRTCHGRTLSDAELAPRVPRRFTISDGTVVDGWLVRARSSSGPTPLLIDVHGGPHGAWNGSASELHLYHHELAAAGWTVLLVNPRGSDGYGEAFFDAVHGAWGIADSRDLLEPLDHLVAEGLADPDRLAVTGHSYGGFLTCHLTAHDNRFAAAVAGGVIVDLAGMAGTSADFPYLSSVELDASAWHRQDRDRLAEQSPYTHVGNVTTPTLVLQGVDDLTCPAGQAQQWHYALHLRGIASRLVLYPGAGHLFPVSGRPSHRIDYGRRLAEWVQRYTPQPCSAGA